MGDATLNGVHFRVDPDSVAWDFKPKVSSKKTVGGKVVQVYGVELGALTVSGVFGVGGWEEQQKFLDRMKALGDNQMDNYPHPPPQPYRFFWPQKKWDMLVWLKGFSDGSYTSVTLANEEINPKWVLTLHIVEDNSGLKKVAADAFIERLSAGLGWEQSVFNGPVTASDATNIWMQVGATTVRDFANIAFGRGTQTPVGNQAVEAANPTASGATASYDAVAGYARAAGFHGEGLVIAIAVAFAESSGVIDALNTNSNGSRDRGLWQINTIHGGTDAELFNPSTNAQYAFRISSSGTNWSPWVTYKNGAHQQYMDKARAAATKAGG